MPVDASKETITILKALGAKIVFTQKNMSSDNPYIEAAFKLHKEIPNSVILDEVSS